MNEINSQLHDVLAQLAVPAAHIDAARARRDAVRRAAESFPGVRASYSAGSVATGVVTKPLEDADGGIILDRRRYPTLGPDGDGDTPTDIVAELHEHIGPLIREEWPQARVHDMKRGLTVRFNAPIAEGVDPYVDLVVAMERKGAPGLWIPSLNASRWDPSHPQKHVELMNTGTRSLRIVRAQAVRLAKGWNKQYSLPVLSSFNIMALALESVDESSDLATAITRFFDHAATSLASSRTDDPAHISGPINYEGTKDQVLRRLRTARDHLAVAIEDPDNAPVVAEALHGVFWAYTPEPIDHQNCERSGKPVIGDH